VAKFKTEKSFFKTHRLATIHPWQTTNKQTDRQTTHRAHVYIAA